MATVTPTRDTINTRLAGAAVIVLLAAIAYIPALSGQFVWDDTSWTTDVPDLLRGFSGLEKMWLQPMALPQYYPLTATTFWIDYQLWGFHTLPYHLENILLHVTAALLFWAILRKLEVPGAWLAAAIFAVHPLMVESVAWITERKNVLSMVLFLGSLLAYGTFTHFWTQQKEKDASRRDWRPWALALVLFVAALFAKATAFCLPAVLLLLCWWKRGKINWKRDLLPTLPFFIASIAYCLGTSWLERNHVGAKGPEWQISMPARFLIAGRVIWFYVGKLLWPSQLCFVYPRWRLNVGSWRQWIFPIGVISILLILWNYRTRIGRGPVTAVLFYVGTLFPALGIMNAYYMRYSFVSDHWSYLSALGLIALAAALAVRAADRFHFQNALYGLSAILLSTLAVLTWRQCHAYADLETLWRDTLAKNPDAWLAHNNLGVLLCAQGKTSEAIAHYQEAMRLDPYFVQARDNMGIILAQSGKTDEAIAQYAEALRINPEFPDAQYNWAVALELVGRNEEAISHYEQAIQLKPNFFDAESNLGGLLIRMGKPQDAIQFLQAAESIRPDSAQTQNNLALAFWQTGQQNESLAQWNLALRNQPDYPEAQNALAWLLATLPPSDGGDPVRSVTLASRACELTQYQVPGYIDTLATAYAADGRFDDAVAAAKKAIDLARAAGQLQLVAQIQMRLQSYEAHRPYSQPLPVAQTQPAVAGQNP
jgi:tetratricopeptide (TPR) repeat protein